MEEDTVRREEDDKDEEGRSKESGGRICLPGQKTGGSVPAAASTTGVATMETALMTGGGRQRREHPCLTFEGRALRLHRAPPKWLRGTGGGGNNGHHSSSRRDSMTHHREEEADNDCCWDDAHEAIVNIKSSSNPIPPPAFTDESWTASLGSNRG